MPATIRRFKYPIDVKTKATIADFAERETQSREPASSGPDEYSSTQVEVGLDLVDCIEH